MFKYFVFAAAILAVALATPVPEAKADPKPSGLLAYSSPLVAAAPVAYSAPLSYAAAPLSYSYGAYPAYSAYSAPYVTYL